MKPTSLWAAALCALGGLTTTAAAKKVHSFPKPPGIQAWEHPNPGTYIVNASFDQPVDHFDPSKGTFSNRFWFSTEYWQGPGSPVFVLMPGESDASQFLGYLDNSTVPGLYAQAFGGLVIVLEHRYFGESQPFDELTAETLRFLDLPNAMLDVAYFAQNVTFDLGGDLGTNDNASAAPWVLIGGSYPGALTAWIEEKVPGVFWAYHASSAVVETVTDFHNYFAAVAEGIPANCSADVRAVVEHVDAVLAAGSGVERAALKDGFGLGYLDHDDDFALQVSMPLREWQEAEMPVLAFCDYLETANGTVDDNSGPDGLGLDVALGLYQAYIAATRGSLCSAEGGTACNTYVNEDEFDEPDDVASGDRQWEWLCCHNPFGWWQVGPPADDAPIRVVPAAVDVHFYERQCPLMFPAVDGYTSGVVDGFTPEHLNLFTGGWDAPFNRVLFVNGELDPWRAVTVSSDYRPGGPRTATADGTPVFVVPGGNHCPELVLDGFVGSPDLYTDMLAIMGAWLDEWPSS